MRAHHNETYARPILPLAPIIPAPDDPTAWEAWRAFLSAWRAETLAKLRYDDSLYQRSDFAWAPAALILVT